MLTDSILNDDTIISFKKEIQCFRHATKEALKERQNNFNDIQKMFIIDYGIMICKLIYYNKNK